MDRTDALKIAQNFTTLVKNHYNCKQAFLFGSYAKGTNSEESDIDIAVIFDKFESAMDIQLDLMRLRRKIDSRIEPHPFREKDFDISNPIVHEILTHGYEINLAVN